MRWRLGFFASIVLALSFIATMSSADPAPDVGSLLDNPDSYRSQVVRITGTVSNHKIRRGLTKCFQSFTLEDDTGSIDAVYKANCSGARNAIRDRDVVTVEGRFESTAHNSGTLQVRKIVSKVAPSAQ